MANRPPPRLWVLLARKAPIGVIFRRGPTEWTRLILWHTENDTFEPGQWIHGVPEPWRSDLSPMGKLLVYFMKGHKARGVAEGYTETWTAVSRPPYWTALALWPLGHTWFGGGVFLNDRTLALNQAAAHHPKHPPGGRLRVREAPADYAAGGIEARLFEHNGWRIREMKMMGGFPVPERMEKPDRKGKKLLTALSPGEAHFEHTPALYEVTDVASGAEIAAFEAEWADWDRRNRLVCARSGGVWEIPLGDGKPSQHRLIADFSDQEPERMEAPLVAMKWPK